MRIYSPTDDKFYDTLDKFDTFDWNITDPELWEGDYCIPHIDDEHEDEEEDWPYFTDDCDMACVEGWIGKRKEPEEKADEELQSREGSDSEPIKTESNNGLQYEDDTSFLDHVAEEEMKQDYHEEEKNEKITKSESDPDNSATESIYAMKFDNEQIVSKFLSLQEFM